MTLAGPALCDPPPNPAARLHGALIRDDVRGSAFYLSDDLAATNAHVVAGLAPGDLVTLRAGAHAEAPARLIAVSLRMDVAFLAAPRAFLPTPARSRRPISRGAILHASGAEVGDRTHGVSLSRDATGVVRSDLLTLEGFGRGFVARMPLAGPGFSGGPVVDDDGRLVGMIAAYRRVHDATPAGSAFAPPRAQQASGMTEVFVIATNELIAEAGRMGLAA